MPRSRCTSLLPLVVLGALSLACSGDPYSAAEPKGDGAGKVAGAEVEGKAVEQTKKAVPDRYDDGKPLGKLLDGAPLPLADMLGQPAPKVESYLGPPLPTSKGGTRKSCVRFVPKRTWFRCSQVWQRYSDKTGTFGVVQVTYEDGKAAAISFENVPGTGPFVPAQALAKVGVEVPGKAKLETPEEGVTVWSWFNSEARLLIHGRQYRVQVSVVGSGWSKSKVEIILNDILDDSEKARVFTLGGDGADASAGEDEADEGKAGEGKADEGKADEGKADEGKADEGKSG